MNAPRNAQSKFNHGLRPWAAAVFLSCLCLHPSSVARAADSPLYIPFQGQVTNQGGALAADGQYSVIFNLYDQAVGGQPVWSERHVKIGVNKGMINVFLGSISPLTAVDFSQTKYLGITVDTDNLATTADPEMVPRSLIMPAFHAKNAEKMAGHNWSSFMTSNNPSTAFIQSTRIDANTITTTQVSDNAVTTAKIADTAITSAKLADGVITTAKFADASITTAKLAAAVAEALVPPGTILPYGGMSAPPGYLMCDGASYSKTGTYEALFAAISTNYGAPDETSFNVPDLRGMFLRGAIPSLQITFTGSPSSNNINVASHPFNRTGMRVRVTTPLTGLTVGTDYFIIKVSATQLAFANTHANALAGTKLAISGTAAGMVVTQAEDPDASTRLAMGPGGAMGYAIGSVQGDELKSHSHRLGNRIPGPLATGASGGDAGWNRFATLNANGTGEFDSGITGGAETRPKNAYVNYIIKY